MTTNFWQEIPEDIAKLILEYIDLKSMVSFSCTNKFFKSIADETLMLLKSIHFLNYEDGVNQLLTSDNFVNLIEKHPTKIPFIVDNIFTKKRFDSILDFSEKAKKDWTSETLKKSLNELASCLNDRSYEALLLQMVKRFNEVALVQKLQQEYRWSNPPMVLTSTVSIKNLSKDYIDAIHSIKNKNSDQNINTFPFSA